MTRKRSLKLHQSNVLLDLRQQYHDIVLELNSEKYNHLPAINETRILYRTGDNLAGSVCGICGLNAVERTMLEECYLMRISLLKMILSME